MDKTPRKDLFWILYRFVLAALLLCAAALLIWISIQLTRYQEAQDLRGTPHATLPSPSPSDVSTPVSTPTVTPTPALTPVPTPDPVFAQAEPRVRMISEEIAAFISGNKTYGEIAPFFVDGTPTKKILKNFVNEYYIHLTSYTLSEWQITDWSRKENGDLSCRVRFLLTAYWNDTLSGTDRMDYRMTLKQVGGEWLVYALNL